MFNLILICDYILIVVISPSSGNIDVCLGETRTFTCNVTGMLLVWGYGNDIALFTSTDDNTGPLTSDIYVQLVSRAGGVIQVRAIVNATSNINGKTLQCRNTPGSGNGTISRVIIFNVQSNCTNNSLTTPLCPLNVLFTLCMHLHPPIASIPQSGRVWSTDLVDQVVPLAW